jgi:hypothetical protein
LAQAAMGHAARLTSEFLGGNGEAVFGSPAAEYGTMNALFAPR